jgi:hypothetical protein
VLSLQKQIKYSGAVGLLVMRATLCEQLHDPLGDLGGAFMPPQISGLNIIAGFRPAAPLDARF